MLSRLPDHSWSVSDEALDESEMVRRKCQGALRLATFCGAFPLAVGSAVFVLWLITFWDVLMIAGLLTIVLGVVLFFFGATAVIYYFFAARSLDPPPIRRRLITLAVASLLLVNVPAAAAFAQAAMVIMACYTVEVHNAMNEPLQNVRISGPGVERQLDSIEPGEIKREWLWARGDGAIEFSAETSANRHAATIEGYVTGGQGGHATVTVGADGVVSVTHP